MKRAMLLSVLAIIVLVAIVSAATNLEESLQKGVDKASTIKDTVSDSEARSAYLKQEWTKILAETSTGKIALKVSDTIALTNPLIRIILGYDYSLSWGFIFAIVIWLILFGILTALTIPIFSSLPLGLLSAFIITCIIGLTGVIRKAVEMLQFAIKNWWIALVSLIIAFVISGAIGRLVQRKIRKMKEESNKEQAQRDQAIIHKQAELGEKEMKGKENKK